MFALPSKPGDYSPATCESLSTANLHALFSSDIWLSSSLTDDDRLHICQEIENRAAFADGVMPREVVLADLEGPAYGAQSGRLIILNSHLVQHGRFVVEGEDFEGNPLHQTVDCPAAGWQILDTLYHEHEHGVQEDKGMKPHAYFEPRNGADWDLYRIQACEKYANERGMTEALNELHQTEALRGQLDPQRDDLLQSYEANSFENALARAQRNYSDAAIEDTLATFIRDQEQGICRDSCSDSYTRIANEYSHQQSLKLQDTLSKQEALTEGLHSESELAQSQHGLTNDMRSGMSM